MTAIYHITHLRNIPNIIKDGGLWCDQVVMQRKLAYVSIAHQHIKDRRAQKSVPGMPGSKLADYVPFYFAPRSPMLYVISKGGVAGYSGGQQPILHLVSSAEAIQAAGLTFTFTDGHAEMDISRFFTELRDLNKIDWDVMQSRQWADTLEDGDRKRRRQAEFLVQRFFPLNLIERIGVINHTLRLQVTALFPDPGSRPSISLEPAWYY
jgi:hypothetical protein